MAVGWRSLMVAVALSLGSGSTIGARAGGDPPALELDPAPVPVWTHPLPVFAVEREPIIVLDRVHWTATADKPLDHLARQWGLSPRTLRKLNPEHQGAQVAAGTQLMVFEAEREQPTRSLGAPNRGRLRQGLPLPEGGGFVMRERRARSYGTKDTVTAILTAFDGYRRQYPSGPAVLVGDLSSRRGGRIFPHASHRTGRDVDIGYVLRSHSGGDSEGHWSFANAENLDVEKTWFLVRALIATGKVQRIFMSAKLQRLLVMRVRHELDPAALARVFSVENDDRSQRSVIRHWKGHRDHMHVRFRCEPGNRRCRARSIDDGA